MARRVFFSFHYDRDVFRVMQVRNSWVVRPGDTAQPFYDKAAFEEVKRRPGGIEKWIEDQLAGTSVTIILFGAETALRPWVIHEIKRSYALGKGMLAIDIHNINAPQKGADIAGANPLSRLTANRNGTQMPLSSLYGCYNWVTEDGRRNMPAWVEAAARAAGR